MTRYGITGPATISVSQEKFVHAVVAALSLELSEDDEFTSGAAFGVDSIGVQAALAAGFRYVRLTIPTGAWYNESLERELLRPGSDVTVAIERTKTYHYAPDAYMKRNDLTIKYTDVLLAFPPNSDEPVQTRGTPGAGTWATVRRARKAGREIRFYPLDNSEPWIENETLRIGI